MNGLQVSLYTTGLALCVFSAGILRGARASERRRVDFFTWFLAIEAAGFALELLMSFPGAPLKSLWLGLRLGSSLFVAPCLWLAVQEIVEGERPAIASLGRKQLWLIATGVVLTLPVIERAHLGTTYAHPERVTGVLHSRFIHATMLACIGIFAWQVPHFLGRCRRLLGERMASGVDRGREAGWLRFAWALVWATWSIGLLRTLHCMLIGYRLDFGPVFALAEVSVAVGAIYAIVRQAAKPVPLDVATVEGAGKTAMVEATPAGEKYARSKLTPVVRERIRRKIEAALANGDIVGDSLLSLRTLSAELKEKAHYVSQVLNQDLGTNFYELVNRRRIEQAKELLRTEPERTVLEIALAVGFNAKSTFNTAFRQQTGMTPTEFRVAAEAKNEE